MENVQRPEKSFGGNNLSVSTFHYKTCQYKWRIQNVSYMQYNVPYTSPTFSAGSEIKCCMVFQWKYRDWNGDYCDLKVQFQLENEDSRIRVIPTLQILSGKGKLESETKLITKWHGSSWGFEIKELNDLTDSDDSLTVLCTIKISLEKMTTRTVNLPSHNLAENFGSMLSSGYLSDLTLICSDSKKLKAHRAILAARSPVFAAMFRHSMKEKQSGRVVVTDVSSEVMEALLNFVYTDQIPSVASELTYELLTAADKYNLARLKAACEEHIMETITIDNACSTLVAADQLHLTGLKQHVLRFIKANIHFIISTEGWSEAALKCPQSVSELSSIE